MFIVVDAPQTRQELVEFSAAEKGLEVVGQAGSVREALQGHRRHCAGSRDPRHSLPDGGGIEVLKEIRRRGRDLCVVVLTGNPYEALRAKCQQLGQAVFPDPEMAFRNSFFFMKTSDADMIQRLGRSNLYIDFKQAFGASTGLPLTLRPLESWQLAHRGQPYENPFCAMIAQTNRGCSASLEAEQRAVDAAQGRPATVRCFADLCQTAVPIKLGAHTIGYLVTGQVALELPSPDRFEAISRRLVDGDSPSIVSAWRTPTTIPEWYRRTDTSGWFACWKSSANSFPPWQIN